MKQKPGYDPGPTEIEKKANLGDASPTGGPPRSGPGSLLLVMATFGLQQKFTEKTTMTKSIQAQAPPDKAPGMACAMLYAFWGWCVLSSCLYPPCPWAPPLCLL